MVAAVTRDLLVWMQATLTGARADWAVQSVMVMLKQL